MKPSPWWYPRTKSLFFSPSPCKGRINIPWGIFDSRRNQTNPAFYKVHIFTSQITPHMWELQVICSYIFKIYRAGPQKFPLRTQILTPSLQPHRPHLSVGITVLADWKNIVFILRQSNWMAFLNFGVYWAFLETLRFYPPFQIWTAFYAFTQNNCTAIIPLFCTPSPKGLGCTQMLYHSTALLFDLPKIWVCNSRELHSALSNPSPSPIISRKLSLEVSNNHKVLLQQS